MTKTELSEEVLSKKWEEFDFQKARRKILKKQQLLTTATFAHNKEMMKKLSLEIVHSIEAKMLAVKKVTEEMNVTSGMDEIHLVKSADKMKTVLAINPKKYHTKPLKRYIITEGKSNKERHIGIPTTFDKIMQFLYIMALEPIAEAKADRKSFAFRKGRSALDVYTLIMHLLNEKNAPEWFLVCDIESYYDTISHNWLLNNIPMDKHILREFIEAGIVFNNEIFIPEVGISLGCSISPILGNMTLDGIQKLLYDLQNKKEIDYLDGYVIRFADDILISARTKEKAEKYLKVIKQFVAERGLKLSDKKTYITNINSGFSFLSRFYYKQNNYPHCIPSEKAVKTLENELYDLILNHEKRWSQKRLIQTINSKLNGWATYHRVSEAKDAFIYIDVLVSALLLNLMKKMYPKQSINQLIKKYWYKDSYERERFTLTTNKSIQVIKLADTVLVEHKMLDIKKNIFLDEKYFNDRTKEQEIQKASGQYKKIWLRQEGKCYYCGKTIKKRQPRKIITKELEKENTIRNMAYVHTFCAEDELVFIKADSQEIEKMNLEKIIQDINLLTTHAKESKFKNLYEYFAKCEKYVFCIKFSEIEEIIGTKLCNSFYKYESYWKKQGKGLISNCWLDNGYNIKKIYLKEKKITFLREKKKSSKINIPNQLMSSSLPKSAKYELEHFFNYVIDKYGL